MPRGDGTGPMGMGPMTGRGAGVCTGFITPGHINPGMSYRMGFGRGCRFRRMYYLTGMPGWSRSGYSASTGEFTPPVDEKEYLNNQVELLKNRLQQVEKRLKEINGDDE